MDKHEVASTLERFSVLLELTDEDPFRSRAFANAARLLEAHPEPLENLIAQNRLSEIKGIGKTLASAITAIYHRGTFDELEQVEEKVPAGVFDLLKVDGLGPKKAKTLWKEANVVSLQGLEDALQSSSLLKLSGFGGKTLEKFQVSLEFLRQQSGRHLRHHAYRAADLLREILAGVRGIKEAFFAGSFRRGCETIGDLDVVVIAEPGGVEAVRSAIANLSQIKWSAHETPVMKGQFAGNFDLDLSVCSAKEAPFRKLIATGSKAHYSTLSDAAARLGFRLRSDGLSDPSGRTLSVECEEDIYRALGLEPVPPALREDAINLAKAGSIAFANPVVLSDLRGILHVHTTASDGHHSVRELATAVREAGFEYLGIADHSQTAAYARGLSPDRVRAQWKEIDDLNREFTPFRILKGTEVDILLDGRLDFEDELLSGFDFVIASIHSSFNMSEERATERLCRAISNPHVDILGHMTGRLLLSRNGYPVNHEQVIACAAKYGKAIELNSSPFRLDIDWRWLKLCEEMQVPVPICPDAHAINGLSDIQYGIDVAAKGPLTANNCLSCWSADLILSWCQTHST